MLNVFCSVFLFLLLAMPSFSQPSNCLKNGKSDEDYCDVKVFDLALAIDYSVKRQPETTDDYERTGMYEVFLSYFFGLLKNKYKGVVRTAILRTDWNAPFYVKMKGFNDDALDDKYRKPPYQSDGSIPTNKSGLGELFAALYDEDAQNGGPDRMKVAVVLTGGTICEQDKNVVTKMNRLILVGYKFYILIPQKFEKKPAELSEIFANQSSIPLNNWEMTTFNIADFCDKVLELCSYICTFLNACQTVELYCSYQLNDDGDVVCLSSSETCQPDCTKAKCESDCDLKGWTEWSECFEGKRIRQRLNESAGHSEFTPSCMENKTEDCTVTEPSTHTTTEFPESPTITYDVSPTSTTILKTSSVIPDGGTNSEFTTTSVVGGTSDKGKRSGGASVWIVVVCVVSIVILVAGIVAVVCYRRAKKSESEKRTQWKAKKEGSSSSGDYVTIPFINLNPSPESSKSESLKMKRPKSVRSSRRQKTETTKTSTTPIDNENKSQIYIMM